jgi:integrase/recombinase XerD
MQKEEVQGLLKQLEIELKLRGASDRTAKTYAFFVEKFLEQIHEPTIQISPYHIKQFLVTLINSHANSSRALATSALRFFCKRILKNPTLMDEIENPKKQEYLPTVLSKEEVKKLLENTYGKSQLMLKMLYSSGLRLSELLYLKTTDLNLEHFQGTVRKGKGGKDRPFFLYKSLCDEIKMYLNERKEQSEWLFPGKNNKPLTARNVQQIIKRAAKRTGIQKNVKVHTLRHSFATHHLQSGTDIRKIQVLLGHSRIDTTTIYTRLTTKDLESLKNPLEDIEN